jgi:hypothetical protein
MGIDALCILAQSEVKLYLRSADSPLNDMKSKASGDGRDRIFPLRSSTNDRCRPENARRNGRASRNITFDDIAG